MIPSVFSSPSTFVWSPTPAFSPPDLSSQWSSTPPEPLLVTPSSSSVSLDTRDCVSPACTVEQQQTDDEDHVLMTPAWQPGTAKAQGRDASESAAQACLSLFRPFAESRNPSAPSKLVISDIFSNVKVWLDMDDPSRNRQEIKQLLSIHGATIVSKPSTAQLFILDFSKGTPSNLLQVPSPVLHTCCRSFEWVRESVRNGAMTLGLGLETRSRGELQTLLKEYESARPRRISSMVPRRSRYVDARVSSSPESDAGMDMKSVLIKAEVKPKMKAEVSSPSCWRAVSLATAVTPTKPVVRRTKEEKAGRKRPLSPYFVKISRSESPLNVPVPSPSKPGQWSRGAYDLATAGWHIAFYAKWSIEGVVGLLAKKYPHRSRDGWYGILQGKTHAAVMGYHDAYVAKWEMDARLERQAERIILEPLAPLHVMAIIDKLRKQRRSDTEIVAFLATRGPDDQSAINWRRFSRRQADVTRHISRAFLDRQRLHLEYRGYYREHRARLDCQALRYRWLHAATNRAGLGASEISDSESETGVVNPFLAESACGRTSTFTTR